MKDMDETSYVLGIKITRDMDSTMLYLDQENYLDKVRKQFKMENCKSLSTSIYKATIVSKDMLS